MLVTSADRRLSTFTDWLTNVTTFTYHDNSRRTAIVRPNGVTSGYAYDAASQVTAITHTGPSGTLMSFAYTYDAAGNRTSVTKDGGNAESYTLDSLNRLTGVTYADGTTQAYTYDATGNRLSLTVNGGAPTTYTYNDADQLTSDGTSTYAYDDNGNLVSRGSDTFTWDYASRMTGATVASTTGSPSAVSFTYTYDGEDTRVAKTVASTPTTYLWDRESGLPLLVDDGSSAFLHSGGALGEISATAREDLIGDALGSVRGVSDNTGALTGSADFDAYGATRASSGSTAAFAFTGEQSDPETGFTYLRARYLDPTVGRFGAVDTVIPNAPGTQGFNAYGYVAGNPTRWVDPSGHQAATWAAGTVIVTTAGLVGLQLLGANLNLSLDKLACYISLLCGPIATVIDRTTPCLANCGGSTGDGPRGNGYDSRQFDQQFLPRPPAGHVGKHPDYEAGGRYYVPPKHADPTPGWEWGKDKNGNEGFVDADGKVWQRDKSKRRVGTQPIPPEGEYEGLPNGAPRQWDYQTGKKNEHINIDPRTGNAVENRGAKPEPAPTAEPPRAK